MFGRRGNPPRVGSYNVVNTLDLYHRPGLSSESDDDLAGISDAFIDRGDAYRIHDSHFRGQQQQQTSQPQHQQHLHGGLLDPLEPSSVAITQPRLRGPLGALLLCLLNAAFAGALLLTELAVQRHRVNPFWFGLVRDLSVGSGLLAGCWWTLGRRRRQGPGLGVMRHDLPKLGIVVTSFAMLAGLLTLGLARGNALSTAAWAPATAVFCVLLAVCLGLERVSKTQLAGTLAATGGALFLVVFRLVQAGEADFDAHGSTHICLALGALMLAVWLMFAPQLLHRYAPGLVLLWCVLGSAAVHAALLGIVHAAGSLDSFCESPCADWRFPDPSIYYLLVCAGVEGLGLLALLICSRQLQPAHVGVACAVQPAALVLLAAFARAAFGTEDLPTVGLGELGGIGSVLGLALVGLDRHRRDRERAHTLAAEFQPL